MWASPREIRISATIIGMNAHQIYEEKHIENEGPNECSQKNKVIGPCKNPMKNCY
jgi:hypothetical protein